MGYPDVTDILRVQREVNADLRLGVFIEFYQRTDIWSIINTGQPVEDYAITKLQRLMALGWPRHTLRLAICFTERDALHALLTVDCPVVGSIAMDSLYPWPKPMELMPYEWISREAAGRPRWEVNEK